MVLAWGRDMGMANARVIDRTMTVRAYMVVKNSKSSYGLEKSYL